MSCASLPLQWGGESRRRRRPRWSHRAEYPTRKVGRVAEPHLGQARCIRELRPRAERSSIIEWNAVPRVLGASDDQTKRPESALEHQLIAPPMVADDLWPRALHEVT